MNAAPIPSESEERTAHERRCIVSGAMHPIAEMVRFVVGPEGEIVPDVAETLPGRGLWVTAAGEMMVKASHGNVFAKAAHAPVKVAMDLTARVEDLLRKRMLADLGLAKRAGQLVLGFDNVLKIIGSGHPPAALVEAREAAADGRRKLAQAAGSRGLSLTTIDCLETGELRVALGRENVIHAAVKPGALANRLIRDCARLKGLRISQVDETAGPLPARNERNA